MNNNYEKDSIFAIQKQLEHSSIVTLIFKIPVETAYVKGAFKFLVDNDPITKDKFYSAIKEKELINKNELSWRQYSLLVISIFRKYGFERYWGN